MLMDKESVLIIGQRPDPHIDIVVEKIKSLGRKVVLFDRWSPAQGITFDLTGRRGTGGRVHTSEGDVDFAGIASVWWRVKPVRPADFGLHTANIEEAFASREWMEMLRSLPKFLQDVPWINVLSHQMRIGYKPRQLVLAQEVGLTCPETIITNRSDSVLDGFELDTPLVYKTLSSFVQPPDEIIFTNEVTQEQIRAAGTEIALAPCIFQRKLAKKYEIRVTVVGEHVFSVGIDSQSDASTKVDWRRNQSREMYFKTKLSPKTEANLLAFHRNAGLVFATYDFILTPNEKEVFLECNPGGQWLWIEQALDLEISSCLAAILAGV
jgi:hypothetical protein